MQRPFRFASPAPPATAVLRPRLLDVLARRFDLRLVTVEAGAGYGKTTLLAQAVAENRLSPRGRDVWLTCEPADTTPSTFAGALLMALTGAPPDRPPSIDDVAAAVWGSAPEPVCIVLDDAHHLGDALLVQELLDALPANGHLLVAARRLPPVGGVRLRLQDDAAHLADTDLALDGCELAELATRLDAPEEVLAGAEGWPALATLRARSGAVDARRFAWEEVVLRLGDADREAFLVLVAAGAADVDALADAVGRPVDGDRLAALPLVATDDDGGLRAHPLWEQLIGAHLSPEQVTAGRLALANALARRGSTAAAFELVVTAGDWDRALELLFDACNDQLHPPWHDQMQRWLALVPPAWADEPAVSYLRGMAARAADAWSPAANDALAEAALGYRARHDLLREAVASTRWAHLVWLAGDRAKLDELHGRGCELESAGLPVATVVALNRGAAGDVSADTAMTLAALDGLTDLEPRLRHFVPLFRCLAHLAAGDADAARPDAGDAGAAGAALPTAAGSGWASTMPALVAWSAGELVPPPPDPGELQSISERVPALVLRAVMAAHLGDVDGARRSLATLDALVPSLDDRDLVAALRGIAVAAIAVADGDEAGAVTALAEHLDGRSTAPAAAGRALRWFPALPWLLHPPSRAVIDSLPAGPSRARVLAAGQALLAGRAGSRVADPGDAAALLTALPLPMACEVAVHARSDHAVTELARLAPGATRAALDRLSTGPLATSARRLLGSVPIPPAHAVRIEVLGPARLLVDGEPVTDPSWRRTRVRQLVAVLAAHRTIRRDRVGVLLWPDFDEAAVSANLRMTLRYVQQLLEPDRPRGHAPWFLQQDAGHLRLVQGDRLSCDLWELESHLDAAAAAATPSLELEHLRRVLELWRGEPLEDVIDEEWAEPVRELLRNRFVRAAVRAGELLVAAGRADEAIAAADTVVLADPWSTAASDLLVRAHTALGDDDGARRAAAAAERRLAELR